MQQGATIRTPCRKEAGGAAGGGRGSLENQEFTKFAGGNQSCARSYVNQRTLTLLFCLLARRTTHCRRFDMPPAAAGQRQSTFHRETRSACANIIRGVVEGWRAGTLSNRQPPFRTYLLPSTLKLSYVCALSLRYVIPALVASPGIRWWRSLIWGWSSFSFSFKWEIGYLLFYLVIRFFVGGWGFLFFGGEVKREGRI